YNDGTVASFCCQHRVRIDFDATIAELMQHCESVERRLRNAVHSDQPEATVKGSFNHTLFFEDIREGPVAHSLSESVALADGTREPRPHIDRIGNVGFVRITCV